ncbi:AN1-like zinc finger domain-containing protein [Ditylenchus destructor]|nr:AN1-like zinc finger domain-containing protein [Ditylenchus destructor]
MAEFPEFGIHCSLKICNKLDFTPFKCESCLKHYCGDHRFNHKCNKIETERISTASADAATTSRKYLCSFRQCFSQELIKIECSECGHNFCLKHRMCEDHECVNIKRPSTDESSTLQKEEPAVVPTLNKTFTDSTQRARADKVTMMKMRMKNPLKISSGEQMFLFVHVESNDDRFPVMISKSWTVGKAIDAIRKQLNLETGKHRWRLFKFPATQESLESSDIISKHLTDQSEVLLRAPENT